MPLAIINAVIVVTTIDESDEDREENWDGGKNEKKLLQVPPDHL